MNKKIILFLCLLNAYYPQIESWHHLFDDIKKVTSNTTNSIKNSAIKFKDSIAGTIPTFLYYIPNFSADNVLLGITNMSIVCNNESFTLIENGVLKVPQLFTRLTNIIGSNHNILNSIQSQNNIKDGLYVNFTYDKSSKTLTISIRENFIKIKKISNIASTTFNLDSEPQEITCIINTTSKTFNSNKTLYITPLLK